jgi:hypothetical protein
LLGRENELSPHRVKDHDAGCFYAVIDEDIRFAVNLDTGFVNRFHGNRPKWFLINSCQDTLDRHARNKRLSAVVDVGFRYASAFTVSTDSGAQ